MNRTLFTLIFILTPLITFSQSKRAFKKEIKEHRKDYKKDFFEDARSPFYEDYKGMEEMHFFKARKKYKVTGKFVRTPKSEPFKMATYSGKTKEFVLYGYVNVLLGSEEVKVHVYQNTLMRRMEPYRDLLFIPFKDLTNDDCTYGGGRYIDLDINDIQDGMLTIDFNKCYNPWCAYSDGYNCPIPPNENHFEVDIKAGERNFTGEKRKRKK